MLWLGLAFAADWQILETPHVRVHVPAEGAELGEQLASRIEGLRERIVAELGFDPPVKTEILLRDRAQPGGAEYRLRAPRIELFATPASADGLDGAGRDGWSSLLVHHLTRIEHGSIPPRGIQDQILLTMLGVAPIPAKSPSWVEPAYATWMEGQVTADGRTRSHARSAWLRQLATAGELPRYEELVGSKRWRGELFASDVGSAYLGWLEEREPGGLQRVWARMTARYPRSFNESFQGVYRDRASSLYQVFAAELTAAAMEGHRPSNTLWHHALGEVSTPAVSPDGRHLAFVHEVEGLETTLKVLETAVDSDRVAKRDAKIARILKRDPADARAVEPRAPPHKVRGTLLDRTRIPAHPRWLDNRTLLYVGPVRDADGDTRMELFQWTVGQTPRRLTHGCDVQRIDARNGQIVGLQSRWGRTRIVEIDTRGECTERVTGAHLDQPRLSADGQLGYLVNEGSGWRVRIEEDSGIRELEIEGVRSLAWSEGGWIGEVGRGGRVDLYRLETGERLTDSGSAFGAEPSGTDLFHLELTSAGFTIHRRDLGPVLAEDPPVPTPAGIAPMNAAAVSLQPVESRADRVRLEPRILAGGRVGGGSNLEAGLRLGDLLGRNELAVLGSVGAASGAGAWWTHRTLPVHLTARVWALRDPAVRVDLGAALTVSHRWHHTTGSVWVEAGGFVETGAGAGTLEAGASWYEPRGQALRVAVSARALGGWQGVSTVLGEVSGVVRLGRPRALYLEVDGAIGRTLGAPFLLGGVSSGVRAPQAQWLAIQPGWMAPGTAVGRARDQIGAAIGRQTVGLMVQRQRAVDGSTVHATSLAGVRMRQKTAREPLLRLPQLEVETGIGCAFEQNGSIEAPCQQINDFRFWSSISWVP